MYKHKKIGCILILVGLCFPLLMLVFATKISDNSAMNYLYAMQHVNPPQEDIVDKIQNLEIVLREKRLSFPEGITNPFDAAEKAKQIKKISLPYKYILATSVLCLFTGIGFLLLGNKPLNQT